METDEKRDELNVVLGLLKQAQEALPSDCVNSVDDVQWVIDSIGEILSGLDEKENNLADHCTEMYIDTFDSDRIA